MPSTDFGDVAARIATGVSGIRACLIVDRDGLSLGAHPADGEARAREVWDLLERAGDLKRGFVEVGMELWVLSRRGPYGAVAVATPDVKPGLVLDVMDANLLAAEQARVRQASEEPAPPPRSEPVQRPRSPLHPEPRLESTEAPPVAEPVSAEADPAPAEATPVVDLSRVPEPEPAPPEPDPDPEPVREHAEKKLSEEPPPPTEQVPTFQPATTAAPVEDVFVAGVSPAPGPSAEDAPAEPPAPAKKKKPAKRGFRRKSGEVDRVSLAREFGRLMQDEFGV